MERAPIKCSCGCGEDLRAHLEAALRGIEANERRMPTDKLNNASAEMVAEFTAEDCLRTILLLEQTANGPQFTRYHTLLTALAAPPVHALIAARIRQILGQPAAAEGVRR